MRIVQATFKNCRSFRAEEVIDFDQESTILVGPNGGGKSNTLDILNVVLRKYFSVTYIINTGGDPGSSQWRDINGQDPFQDIQRILDRHSEAQDDDQVIKLAIRVGETDIANVQSILDKKDAFLKALTHYRNTPYPKLDMLGGWTKDLLKAGDELRYVIRNHALEVPTDPKHRLFRDYLLALNFFILLARDVPNAEIRPTLLYFSPYRGATQEDLQAILSQDNFFNILSGYFNSTSRQHTSLLKLATFYFADKKRRLEVTAREAGYEGEWAGHADVTLVSDYLRALDFDWDLALTDSNRNTYEISLRRKDRSFAISRASSGEKEILNFVFGVVALGTRDGLLIVDEPEVHLHPRWQALLRDLFVKMAKETGNQFVLSTHSPVFITPQTIGNIRRVAKDASESTRVSAIMHGSGESEKALLHIVNSHNNERVFFADRVLLVEGIHDRLVLARLIELYREAAKISEVVEVVEVFGKDNFSRYRDFLTSLGVPSFVVADRDYAAQIKRAEIGDLFEVGWRAIDQNVLKKKKSKDRETLAQVLADAVNKGDMSTLKEFWQYVQGRHTQLRGNLGSAEVNKLENSLRELKTSGIHALRLGEIEDYLPAGFQSLEKTIDLMKPENTLKWLKECSSDEHFQELEEITHWVLNLDLEKRDEFRAHVLEKLEAA